MLNPTEREIIKFLTNNVVLLSTKENDITKISLGYIQSNTEVKIIASTSIK